MRLSDHIKRAHDSIVLTADRSHLEPPLFKRAIPPRLVCIKRDFSGHPKEGYDRDSMIRLYNQAYAYRLRSLGFLEEALSVEQSSPQLVSAVE